MFDIDKLINEAYGRTYGDEPLSFEQLAKMVEDMIILQESLGILSEDTGRQIPTAQQQADSKEITMTWRPYLPISEIAWGTASGDHDGDGTPDQTNPARDQLKMYLKRITDKGGNLGQKIADLNAFLAQVKDGKPEALEDMGKALSFMMFYRTLYDVITDFNAAAAGFIFESFLSVLLDAEQGHQVPASGAETIADFIVYAGGRIPISLKVYAESGLKVGGSYKQIVSDLTGEFDKMQYVVVTKKQVKLEGGKGKKTTGLKFAAFNIELKNLPYILSLTKHGMDQMLLPVDLTDAYSRADKDIEAVKEVLKTRGRGIAGGKKFKYEPQKKSEFGPDDLGNLPGEQQRQWSIALDIPPKTRLSINAGIVALTKALKTNPLPDPDPALTGVAKTEYDQLQTNIKDNAEEWFKEKYDMTSTNPLEIGQSKDSTNSEIYLFNSGGTETPVTPKSDLRRDLWNKLYTLLQQALLPDVIKQAHSKGFRSGLQGRTLNNYLYYYIDNAIKAGMEAQQIFKAKKKGKKDDPHSLRVKSIYGNRTSKQKKASFEILVALGKESKKQYIKKALHLTAGYQGVGGNTQFEITGKGKFKDLYSSDLITLPYGGTGKPDGTFATISLDKGDVEATVNTVLNAFNRNMKEALNGMQDLINHMNQYVLGGMEESKPAIAAKNDADGIEKSMGKVIDADKNEKPSAEDPAVSPTE